MNLLSCLASLLPDRFWLWMSEFAAEECDRRAFQEMPMPEELREFLYCDGYYEQSDFDIGDSFCGDVDCDPE